MSGWGTTGANLALSAVFGTGRFLALGTGIGAGGALLGEVSGGNYSRAAVPALTVTGNTATNAGAITFATPSATLGSFTHAAIMDAASGGNVLASGPLLAPVNWTSGLPVSIAAGDLDLTGVLAA